MGVAQAVFEYSLYKAIGIYASVLDEHIASIRYTVDS